MSGTPILEPAPAKINLYLHVTGQRADGFHTLDTLVVFASFSDSIYVRRATDDTKSFTLDIVGRFAADIPVGADNLVSKAADLMLCLAQERGGTYLTPAHITLNKRIPAASGIGGGSADAAATMRALNQFWGLHAPFHQLIVLAKSLGSDVPMCLLSHGLRASGTGEKIDNTSGLPALAAVLVNPGIELATPQVFAALTKKKNPRARDLPATPVRHDKLIRYLNQCRNDLEIPASNLIPEIKHAITALKRAPDCHLARMSGSGATCFGVFEDMLSANKAARQIANARPNWWVQVTEFNRAD